MTDDESKTRPVTQPENGKVEDPGVEATLPAGDVADSWADPQGRAGVEYAQRFELRQEVGRGGIGRVMLAFDPELGREVAVKELLPRYCSSGSEGEGATPSGGAPSSPAEVRFLDEARITAQLEHPGIVPVHDLGRRVDGRIFYAMRMVRGPNLRSGMAGRDLRGRLELLPNFLDLCHAIAYAHSRGVVHRDLKPDNVMLGEFGETLVLDWGLAKVRGKEDQRMEDMADGMLRLRESSGTETVMGAPLGTPAYMPPEQAAGELDLIDARSDVYSLGAILYELLTGRPPHTGDSALEVLEKVGHEEIVPAQQREAEAPPELGAICARALARRPGDRYTSAKLLAEDVLRFQVGGLVRAHTYSVWDLARRWMLRHRRAIALVTAVLVVAAGGWWYRGYVDAHRLHRAEQRRQARVVGEVERILAVVARGPRAANWLDLYAFKLIALKESVVERRLLHALAHPEVRVRRLAARSLGGMKSRQAVGLLRGRLAKGVEPSETVVIAVINALGFIGDSRANGAVHRARYRHGQHGAVWRNTELAYRTIPLPPLPKTGVTVPGLMFRGQSLLDKGDLTGALVMYDRAIERDPRAARAFGGRAVVRKRMKDLRGALADYNRAIALDPAKPRVRLNRAFIFRRQGRFTEALRDLAQVVASPKHRAMGRRARAIIYTHMGRMDDALRDYRAAFALTPGRASIPYNMAHIWAEKGDLTRALASLEQALAVQPGYCEALTVRAAIRQQRGDLAGALVDAERAVALDPAYLYAYARRGQVLQARGSRTAARADFDKAIALAPKAPWRWAARAAFYHHWLGRYEEAARDFEQALALVRSSEVAHRYRVLLAAVALRSGDRAGARRRLDAIAVNSPAGAYGSAVLFVRGKLDRAAFIKAVPFTSRRRAYLAFLEGLRAELVGDLPAARKRYTAALIPYRWSSIWYALATHSVKVLGRQGGAPAPGPSP